MCIKTGGLTQCTHHDHDLHFRGLVHQEGKTMEKWECISCGHIEFRNYDGFQDSE